MRLDNLLRFDYWFDFAAGMRPAGPAMWLVVLAGLLGCGLLGAALARGRLPREVAIAWMLAASLTSLVSLGRLLAHPVLGLRAGWLIAALLALAPLAARAVAAMRADGLLKDCLNALAFAPTGAKGRWRVQTIAAWLAFHLLGLAVVFANLGLPVLLAPALITGLLLLPALAKAQPLSLAHLPFPALTPFVITYAVTVLHFAGVRPAGIWNGVFSPALSLIVMSAYGLAIGGRQAAKNSERNLEHGDQMFVRRSAALLIAASIAWSAWATWALRTYGVTGSDPYAYAQMGVDLATRGTLLHSFPLAQLAYGLDVSLHPVVHVGYRIPDPTHYQSATVWPPGYAIFTALAYLLAGEDGLFLITPLINLLVLLTTGWFVLVAMHWPSPTAIATAALTVMVTATSYQQVEWQMMPMADIAAQLFTLLAVGLALSVKSERQPGAWARAVLSGLCLGIAFDLRYTQVLLALAIALALVWDKCGIALTPRRLGLVAACASAALSAAMPTLIYHQLAFGNPLATGSDELTHFSLVRLPETLGRTLGELNHYREFGLLTPLIAIGLVTAARHHRRALVVVLVVFIVLFGFHVLYAYLRLRDILFLFPFLSWLAALGATEAIRLTYRAASTLPVPRLWDLARVGLVCTLSFCFVLRAMETLAMPATRGFNAFGYLVREQRASFDQLRQATPEDAVVAASLNSGAIELHAQRLAFRPAGWTADELARFVEALHAQGRPVFALDDGEELGEALQVLRARYGLAEVVRLDVPYYDAVGGGSRNRRVSLYHIAPRGR
jgi:hypothetical protein